MAQGQIFYTGINKEKTLKNYFLELKKKQIELNDQLKKKVEWL